MFQVIPLGYFPAQYATLATLKVVNDSQLPKFLGSASQILTPLYRKLCFPYSSHVFGTTYYFCLPSSYYSRTFNILKHFETFTKLETCIGDIRWWMVNNHLELNDSKTEFLFVRSKFGKHPTKPTITIGEDKIPPAATARNFRVLFDKHLTLKPHVASLCKSAFFHIHRNGGIRKFLTTPAAKTVVHAIITFRLDYCNGIFMGLPDCDDAKLQSARNSAACLIYLTHKEAWPHHPRSCQATFTPSPPTHFV